MHRSANHAFIPKVERKIAQKAVNDAFHNVREVDVDLARGPCVAVASGGVWKGVPHLRFFYGTFTSF